jgi:hypothetical protein
MHMRSEWLCGLRDWARANDTVRQLWLFGSRARGDSRGSFLVSLTAHRAAAKMCAHERAEALHGLAFQDRG